MIQKRNAPIPDKAVAGLGIGAAWADEAWRNYSICYSKAPTLRPRQIAADERAGGQHGLQ